MKSFKLIAAITLLSSCIALSTSCKKKRCQNKEVGSIELNEVSTAYLTYENGETVIFQNPQGNQLVFEVEVFTEPYFICTKYLCEATTGPFETVPCENYSTTGFRHLLKQTNNTVPEGDIFINLSVGAVNYEEESTLFYDLFAISMSGIGGLADGQAVPFVHFNDPVFDSSQSEINSQLTMVESVEVNGNTYENMLLSTESENMIYYEINGGIKVIKLAGSYFELIP